MIAQLEFQEILDCIAPAPPTKAKPLKQDINLSAYTLGLAAALKSVALSHALFNLLTSIARAQALRGYATTAQAAIDLGITFNAVHLQLHKSPNMFSVSKTEPTSQGRPAMNALRLTPEAIALLVTINKKAKRYALSQSSNS